MARILVIDDDELVGRTIARVLTRGGHEVVTATGGAQGCALFDAQRPDLVLSDLVMPEQSGVEVVRELRRRDPDMRIAVLTGGESFGVPLIDSLGPLKVGAILRKPFEIADLLGTVDALLAAPAR
ncbi:response regulator [Azospirillum sp. SYSU D00513]|uniref:response regulator n=1 Tax=Azospirillum sp. SYSU D00513 TaxID=2812561 RepID=UPI001A96D048|nr:response regulator [Azospirillum sp. SYSU D00513]